MNLHDTEEINKFFSTIAPWFDGYSHIGISYFAIKNGSDLYLQQARLFLMTSPSTVPATTVETASMTAGYMIFSDMCVKPRELVDQLLNSGGIESPSGTLIFPTKDGNDLSVYFDPFHQEGLQVGNRLSVLSITGTRIQLSIDRRKLDWELKGLAYPYDSLEELLSVLMLGNRQEQSVKIEIIANLVAAINLNSVVSGVSAKPSVFLAKSLDRNKVQIGYRMFLKGKVIERCSIIGGGMTWSEQGEHLLLGEGQIEIPLGAALHCVVSYDGEAQHQAWLADMANSPNARRVSYEAFDEGFEVLRDFLFRDQRAKKDARDFEFGIAWLIWMLGFSPAHFGATGRTSDAADIVAVTPQGNFLVIECTIGLLKAENKLPNLVARTEVIRKRLTASGAIHLKVLPIIVTAKTKDEVKADLEQAQKLEILVVTQESLLTLLDQTIAMPDPEAIYTRAWDSVQLKPETVLSAF